MRRSSALLIPSLVGLVLASGGVYANGNKPAVKPKGQTVPRTIATKVVTATVPKPPSPPKTVNLNEGLFSPEEGLFKRGPRDDRTLVLTFDDGPHPESAEPLLNLLRLLDVKATFFVVGERVKARPDLVRRMIAEGHEVANHTEDHQRLHELPEAKVIEELRGCEDDVRRATGRAMTMMRPPGMRFTPAVLKIARNLGYVTVDVNNVAGDYVPNGGVSDLTPEEAEAYGLTTPVLVERVEKQFKPGTIVLLHDNTVTLTAVAEIVARARTQGYRFVTTAEMLSRLPDPVKIVANPPAPK